MQGKPVRVYAEIYGCTLNAAENNALINGLMRHGFAPASNPKDADLIILGTCTVIENTEHHMLKRLRALNEFGKKIVVTGCMASAQPEIIHAHAPQAILIEPGNYENILIDLNISARKIELIPMVEDVIASVPIANGCTGRCTYCITRIARGVLRSTPVPEIKRNVEQCVRQGAREIRITAQDTAAYGLDINTNLAHCISELCKIRGRFMLRIGMMNPVNAIKHLDEIIQAYANPKVFKFVHIPVQSGSDKILREMKRGYSVEEFRSVVNAFRKRFKKLTISTDIIVGYPAENAEDFEETLKLMEEIKPDIINVTRFSPREGTEAYKLKALPQRIVKERSRLLVKLRFGLSRRNLEHRIGKCENVLITEKGKKNTMIGRTVDYKPVIVSQVPIGTWAKVKITGATDIYLTGKVIGEK